MNLLQNPFNILNVSPRSPRQEIFEQADERSLVMAPEACTTARAILTHPMRRIAAELSWMPGVPPKTARAIVDAIEKKDPEVRAPLNSIHGVAYCNIAASLMEADFLDPKLVVPMLLLMAKDYDLTYPKDLLEVINGDRMAAGMPEILSVGDLEDSLTARRRYYVAQMMHVLDGVPDPDLVLTQVLANAQAELNGVPRLLEDLVEAYEVEGNIRKYLDQKENLIRNLSLAIRTAVKDSKPKATISAFIVQLEKGLNEWNQVARPIQIVKSNRGSPDEASDRLAGAVRSDFVELANKHGMHEEALKSAKILAEAFESAMSLQDQVAEDVEALGEVIEKKRSHDVESETERQKLAEEAKLFLDIGSDRLMITIDNVVYQGYSIKTGEIERIWWGVQKNYTNGIRTSREYTVCVATPSRELKIECVRFLDSDSVVEMRFAQITDSLWKVVVVRLITEMLSGLASARKYSIGEVVVHRDGIELEVHKFLGTDKYLAPWSDLSIRNGAGTFVINSNSNKKAYAVLKYRETWNVHVLEAVMRFLLNDGNHAKLASGSL